MHLEPWQPLKNILITTCHVTPCWQPRYKSNSLPAANSLILCRKIVREFDLSKNLFSGGPMTKENTRLYPICIPQMVWKALK